MLGVEQGLGQHMGFPDGCATRDESQEVEVRVGVSRIYEENRKIFSEEKGQGLWPCEGAAGSHLLTVRVWGLRMLGNDYSCLLLVENHPQIAKADIVQLDFHLITSLYHLQRR